MILQCIRCADGLLAITPPPKLNISTAVPINASHPNLNETNSPLILLLETTPSSNASQNTSISTKFENVTIETTFATSKGPIVLSGNSSENVTHSSAIEISSTQNVTHSSTIEISSPSKSEVTAATATHEISSSSNNETTATSKSPLASETSPAIDTSSKNHSTSLKPEISTRLAVINAVESQNAKPVTIPIPTGECAVYYQITDINVQEGLNFSNESSALSSSDCARTCFLDGCTLAHYYPNSTLGGGTCRLSYGYESISCRKPHAEVGIYAAVEPLQIQCIRCIASNQRRRLLGRRRHF